MTQYKFTNLTCVKTLKTVYGKALFEMDKYTGHFSSKTTSLNRTDTMSTKQSQYVCDIRDLGSTDDVRISRVNQNHGQNHSQNHNQNHTQNHSQNNAQNQSYNSHSGSQSRIRTLTEQLYGANLNSKLPPSPNMTNCISLPSNNSQMCEKLPHVSDVRDTCVPRRQEPQRQQQRIAEVRLENRETHEKRVQLQRNETQNYDQMCKKSGDCGLTVPITEKIIKISKNHQKNVNSSNFFKSHQKIKQNNNS